MTMSDTESHKVYQMLNTTSMLGKLNLTEMEYYCLNSLYDPNQSDHIKRQCVHYLSESNQSLLDQIISVFGNFSVTARDDKLKLPFDNDWTVILIWSLIFGSMVLLAIIGNLLIIWIVSTKKLMRTVINIFLLNLTISDLLTVTFNASFNFVFMITANWPFGYFYCVASNFITNLTIASSVFTIIATSVDRYIAIVHPLKPRMTKKRTILIITIIWLSAIFFSTPTLLYSKIIEYPYPNGKTRNICLLKWPDGLAGHSRLDFVYNIAFLLLTYILPLVTMAIAYFSMSRVLWGSERIGESTQIQQELIKSKKKVVCMLICIITVFCICWLPYHCYFLCIFFWPQLIRSQPIQHIYLAIYWLAMANSLFNPIILFIMNKRFQNFITYYIRCRCLVGNEILHDSRVSVLINNIHMTNKIVENNNKNSPNYKYVTEVSV